MVDKVIYQDDQTGRITEDPSITSSQLTSVVNGVKGVTLIAGENIAIGDPIYIDNATGKAFRAQANDIAKMPAVLVASEAVSINNSGVFIDNLRLTGLSFVSSDIGKIIYVGSTGGLTTTAPSMVTNIRQKVGIVLSTTEAFIDRENPSEIHINDSLVMMADNVPFSTTSGTFVFVMRAVYNRSQFIFLGTSYSATARVVARMSRNGSIGEVQLRDFTHNVILNSTPITVNTTTNDVYSVALPNMPASGVIAVDCEARMVSGGGSIKILYAEIETVVS